MRMILKGLTRALAAVFAFVVCYALAKLSKLALVGAVMWVVAYLSR